MLYRKYFYQGAAGIEKVQKGYETAFESLKEKLCEAPCPELPTDCQFFHYLALGKLFAFFSG